MPTYSYACTACENRFDIYQDFSDDALTTCSECQGRLRKLFGSVGVSFKGSGFYLNDHGKASNTKPATKPSAPETSGSTASASSDSGKPAKSSESKPAKSSSPQAS